MDITEHMNFFTSKLCKVGGVKKDMVISTPGNLRAGMSDSPMYGPWLIVVERRWVPMRNGAGTGP